MDLESGICYRPETSSVTNLMTHTYKAGTCSTPLILPDGLQSNKGLKAHGPHIYTKIRQSTTQHACGASVDATIGSITHTLTITLVSADAFA